MKTTLTLLLCAGFAVLGCSKSEPAPPVAVASAAPVAASVAAPALSVPDPAATAVDSSVPLNTAAPAAAPAVAAKAVPTEADYEVKAESTITPANAAQVLAAIEAQVGK